MGMIVTMGGTPGRASFWRKVRVCLERQGGHALSAGVGVYCETETPGINLALQAR